VREGDTVYDIATRHGVSVEAVVRANSLPHGGRWVVPGTVLRIPGGSGTATAAPPPSGAAGSGASGSGASSSGLGGSVTVRAGDTLSHLALRHGVSVNALVATNTLSDSRLIYPGQVLRLPGSGASSSAPSRATSTSSSASGSSSSSASGGTYTVRAGDTLSGIAARHGVSVSALAKASGVSAGSFIHPGQKLRLPGAGSSTGSSSSPSRSTAPLTRPYDESTIGDLHQGEDVDDTFLHYRYGSGIARSAKANREYLASVDVPSRDRMREMIGETAQRHGVDPKLMVALSYQESGWNHRAVSPANAIGAMQVIPSSGEWASSLIGRELNLLDPQDNVTAGVVIMRALQRSAASGDDAIGGYYQGLASVRQHGMFSDTQQYVRNIRHLMRTL
jgi:LysM repeat protein